MWRTLDGVTVTRVGPLVSPEILGSFCPAFAYLPIVKHGAAMFVWQRENSGGGGDAGEHTRSAPFSAR
jgi:hypothetical protein